MVSKGWGRMVFISSRIGAQYPGGRDPLWRHQDRAAVAGPRPGEICRRQRVTVNSVLPGPTISDGFAEMLKDEVAKTGQSLEELAKAFVMTHRPSSVIQRAASVAEVANMVVYVCSPQALSHLRRRAARRWRRGG